MSGGWDPQRSLFGAHAWPHRVPDDWFYAGPRRRVLGRLGTVKQVLFRAEDLELYL